MTGHARRSAGVSAAPVGVASAAKRAVDLAQISSGLRRRPYAISAAAVATALCAGLVLTASAPVSQSAVAAPLSATGTLSRDVDTLSRGSVDREALIPVSALASPDGDETTAAPAPTVLYVVSAAYLRAKTSASASVLTTLAAGAQVTAVGDAAGGWQQVTAVTQTGYVKSALLTTSAPTKKAVSSSAGAASSAYPACASGSAVEAGLVANTILVHRAVCATFPDITAYGGTRGDGSEHASGKALDIMTSGARGAEIAAWLQANYSKLGIVEIIYQQKIWTTQRASEGWRAMPDRGSATANHYDHIHVLVA
jgi:Bacterial SH3 domain